MDNFEDEDGSTWSIGSVFSFIKDNIIQLLMLFSVFVIIYVVDHISNINSVIFSMPSAIPGLPGMQPKNTIVTIKKNKKK